MDDELYAGSFDLAIKGENFLQKDSEIGFTERQFSSVMGVYLLRKCLAQLQSMQGGNFNKANIYWSLRAIRKMIDSQQKKSWPTINLPLKNRSIGRLTSQTIAFHALQEANKWNKQRSDHTKALSVTLRAFRKYLCIVRDRSCKGPPSRTRCYVWGFHGYKEWKNKQLGRHHRIQEQLDDCSFHRMDIRAGKEGCM